VVGRRRHDGADLETAQGFADGRSARIGLDTDTWMALAERVFAERRGDS